MTTFVFGFIMSLLAGSVSATPTDVVSAGAAEAVSKFPLREHVPSALPFHCVAGEESLGCAARPASPARGEDQ